MTIFESKPCSRCGGSGHYSFNLIDGSRCYGCNGRGVTLTKRGLAARNWLDEKRKIRAADLKTGDLLWFDMSTFKCCERIQRIENIDTRLVISATRTKTGEPISWVCGPDYKLERGFSKEEKIRLRDAALAYQDTLTKLGKPSKRGKK